MRPIRRTVGLCWLPLARRCWAASVRVPPGIRGYPSTTVTGAAAPAASVSSFPSGPQLRPLLPTRRFAGDGAGTVAGGGHGNSNGGGSTSTVAPPNLDSPPPPGAAANAAGAAERARLLAVVDGWVEQCRTKMRSLQKERVSADSAEKLGEWGSMVVANLYRIPAGATTVEVPRWDGQGREVTEVLELDPAAGTPNEQAEKAFNKARKLRRGSKAVATLIEDTAEVDAVLQVCVWGGGSRRGVVRAAPCHAPAPLLRCSQGWSQCDVYAVESMSAKHGVVCPVSATPSGLTGACNPNSMLGMVVVPQSPPPLLFCTCA